MKLLSYLWKEINTFSWTGTQPSTPYDTAWVSSVVNDQNKPLFPESLNWVVNQQHSDGSWGINDPYFFICEQMTSTLSSIRSLVKVDKEKYSSVIDRGVNWVNENIKNLDNYLQKETVKTVGFELIFPSLLQTLDQNVHFTFNTGHYLDLMNEKLPKIPFPLITNARTPLLYSIEFLDGLEKRKQVNLDYLLSRDGSISTSPSASAFYLSLKPKTSEYLTFFLHNSQNVDGGWPAYKNGSLFSIVYSLYMLQKAHGQIPSNLKYLLRFLDINWTPMGIGIGENFVIQDLDDTVLALKLFNDCDFLTPQKKKRYWDVLDSYFDEKGGYFRTFPFENDPSFLVNIHALDALKGNKTKKKLYYDNLLAFLEKEILIKKSFSIDKYYYSPYLQNARAILSLSDDAPHLSEKLLKWFLESQRDDGLWGKVPNIEELAHVVLALSYYNNNIEKIDLTVLNKSVQFIEENLSKKDSQYLWIAKSFFAPSEVITSNIYSSLLMYNESLKVDRPIYSSFWNHVGSRI